MAETPQSEEIAPARRARPGPRGSRLKAIAAGCLVDIGGSLLFGVVLMLLLGITLGLLGVRPEMIQHKRVFNSPAFELASVLYGTAFTVLGGYVAARIANYLEYRTALWVGVISLLFGEVMQPLNPDYPMWARLVGDLIVIPAALFGASLKVKQCGKG
jgi:hypothetical protein